MRNLSSEQLHTLEKVAQKHGLELVLLFGSRATGKARPDSDYDIAYLSSQALDFNRQRDLVADLLPVVQPHDERLLDVLDLRKADPLLFYQVAQEARVLYGTRQHFQELRQTAFKRYIDTIPLRKLEEVLIRKRQRAFRSTYAK